MEPYLAQDEVLGSFYKGMVAKYGIKHDHAVE